MTKIFLIYENKDWSEPLERVLREKNVPHDSWNMVQRSVDLFESPPQGIFYNRMSASAHTRGHLYEPELTLGLLTWLEVNKRQVINGVSAIRLELSKVFQYSALKLLGINYPRTIATISTPGIVEAANVLGFPIILKPNRAGKGFGVNLFNTPAELKEYVSGDQFVPSVDGITLVQDFIESLDKNITRVEFVAQKFLYALKVDTSRGFELCPADYRFPSFTANIQNSDLTKQEENKFEIDPNFLSNPLAVKLIPRLENFMRYFNVSIASFEFVVDSEGIPFVYDINTNTNYNGKAESKVGISGLHKVVQYLASLLTSEYSTVNQVCK